MRHISPILDKETEVLPTRYHRDSWTLVKCKETDLVFLPNAPEYIQLESEFSWEKQILQERERRNEEEPILSRISKTAKRTKRMLFPKRDKMVSMVISELEKRKKQGILNTLDIGCANGEVLLNIHKKCENIQIKPIGIEVSKQLAASADKNLAQIGGTAIQSSSIDAAQVIDHKSIHVIVMRSFLEHEKHPAKLLKVLHKVLTDDGAIIIKVPNFDCWNRHVRGNKWCGFRYPDHVNYFTPATLERTAKETGFIMSKQGLLERFPTSDNMYAVYTKRTA